MSHLARLLGTVICIVLSTAAMTTSAASKERPVIHFSCGMNQNSPAYKVAEKLYQQAFNALGFDFSMHYASWYQSNNLHKFGHIDGMCSRSRSFDDTPAGQQMIRVDTSLASHHLYLWTYNSALQQLSAAQVRTGNHSVAYIRGGVSGQAAVKKYGFSNYRTPDNYQKIFQLMQQGRLDFIIAVPASIHNIHNLLSAPLPLRGPRLQRVHSFPYLAAKNEDLAQPLAIELKRLLADPKHPAHAFSSVPVNRERPNIHLTCLAPPDSAYFKTLQQLFQQAFDALGYDFSMEHNPLYRTKTSDLLERTDGDCSRSELYGSTEEGQSRVAVPVTLYRGSSYLWSYRQELLQIPLASLANSRHSIGLLKGDSLAGHALKQLGISNLRTPGDNLTALNMLHSRRIDFLVLPEGAINSVTQHAKSKLPKPLRGHRLAQFKTNLYLDRQHENLVAPLTVELKRLLSDPEHPFNQQPRP